MPAYFVVDLSPPRSNQGLSPDMSPSTYLRDPNMLSFLRRAIPFEIGPEIMRCTLDPPPAEIDRTIAQYHKRVYEACSKAEISVLMPVVGNALKEVSRYFEIWEAKLEYEEILAALAVEQNKTFGKIVAKREPQNEDKGTQIEGLKTDMGKLHTLLTFMTQQTEARIKMYKATILVDFVKKAFADLHLEYPGELEDVKDTKTTRYAQAAQSLNQRQLEAFFKEDGEKLAPEYYEVLQNITKYIGGRNETAHESHIEFAELLETDQYHKKGDYRTWANLFRPVYGKTIEEIMDDQKAKELVDEKKWYPVED